MLRFEIWLQQQLVHRRLQTIQSRLGPDEMRHMHEAKVYCMLLHDQIFDQHYAVVHHFFFICRILNSITKNMAKKKLKTGNFFSTNSTVYVSGVHFSWNEKVFTKSSFEVPKIIMHRIFKFEL